MMQKIIEKCVEGIMPWLECFREPAVAVSRCRRPCAVCFLSRAQIDDTMFEAGAHVPDGPYQMIFGLAVLPEFRRRGVAAALLRQMIASSHTLGLASIALTCKAEKIGYYARFGFAARGISASVHGGAVWYDMTLENP